MEWRSCFNGRRRADELSYDRAECMGMFSRSILLSLSHGRPGSAGVASVQSQSPVLEKRCLTASVSSAVDLCADEAEVIL